MKKGRRGRGGGGGGRGGGRGGHGGGHGAGGDNRPRKEAILDLTRYMDTQVRIKFTGGREGNIVSHYCTCIYIV